MNFAIKHTIKSDLYEIKSTMDDILERLCQIIKDESLLFDIRLILNELIVNSALHGNHCDKNKLIKLVLEVQDKLVKIEIIDEGCGFVYDKDSYDPLELRCCGRGLVLVDGLSDEFYVNKNKVVSIKYI
ncbi:serine/threonine-protein kinase RsbW [Proteiniborus ethanoligenes]|uniref:Serine/threonine-protein kinase RsbW n=1 Tax=Proteiniborus ethanoligenes TaxID=415015 RepID=A0A1H3Q3R6_9FIRM|nr:ATP-binding protein [Proteiniborus ethanoligenes]SDZ08027.1 serine/threonine-protein kinase RsbW [Proteiniborus ethanoligenes]